MERYFLEIHDFIYHKIVIMRIFCGILHYYNKLSSFVYIDTLTSTFKISAFLFYE